MNTIQRATFSLSTFRRSSQHKHRAERNRRDSRRGRFEELERRMVLSSLALTPLTLPQDTMRVAYSQAITTTGDSNPITLTVTNIKHAITGLTVPSSGSGSLLINGTPTAAGTETFTVTATDSLGAKTSHNYSLTVNPVIGFTPATLPGDTLPGNGDSLSGPVTYSQTITTSGGTGPVNLVISNLQNPQSLPLTVQNNGTSISISGTPTFAGTETFTVIATDSVGATSQNSYTIAVNPPLTLPALTLPADPEYNVIPYNQAVTSSGGSSPVSMAVTSTSGASLGLTMTSSNGTLTFSGVPTAYGTETFNVQATDAAGVTATNSYIVTADQYNPSGVVFTSVTGGFDAGCASFIDSNQNIVVAGISNSAVINAVRYQPNGCLDTSFNGTGFTTTPGPKNYQNWAYAAADYPSAGGDKIVVGGIYLGSSADDFAVVRYNNNGSLDTSFGSGGEAVTDIGGFGYGRVDSVVVLPDGDIAAGGAMQGDTYGICFALASYTPAGKLDTTFHPGAGDPVAFTTQKGTVTTDISGSTHEYITSMALQTVGTQTYILAGGLAVINGSSNYVLVRYNLNGSLDTTFGTNGIVIQPSGGGMPALAVDSPTGNIYLGGEAGGDLAIDQFSPSGVLDTAYTNNVTAAAVAGGISGPGYGESNMAVQPQADGTVKIVAGAATVPAGLTLPSGIAYDPNYSQALVRFNADGTLDTSFGVDGYAVAPSSSPLQLQLSSVNVQSDGDIVYAGGSSISSLSRQFVTAVQFSPDGQLNTSFGNPTAQGQTLSSGAAMAVMAAPAATGDTASKSGEPSVRIKDSPVVDAPQALPSVVSWTVSVPAPIVGPRWIKSIGGPEAAVRQANTPHGLSAWSVDRVLAELGALDLLAE
ncbi:MAG: delta-60 repeat domain-containing protein [Thermoguttaceae bacterium]|jgi:uncharacterized delta-60 repeat protein